jgi:hypothetical protein
MFRRVVRPGGAKINVRSPKSIPLWIRLLAGTGHYRCLIVLSCSGALPVDPLAARGIFPRVGSVFEGFAPFVVGKFAPH